MSRTVLSAISIITLAASSPLVAQTRASDAAESAATPGCIESFDAATDYFTDKVMPEYSTFWDISYHGSYKVLRVQNSEFPTQSDLRYVLVQCGAPAPELTDDLAGALVVEVPVRRTLVNHTNGLAMLDQIGVLDTIVGMSNSMLNYASDPWYARVIEAANNPQNLGASGIDYETALGLEGDIIVMAGYGPGYNEVADARERGLPAIMVSNRIEPTPLASSEWMKFLSTFYNAEAAANEAFDVIESAYQQVADQVREQLPDGYEVAYACIGDQRGCSFMYAHGDNSLNGQILKTLGVSNPFSEGNSAGNGMTFDYESALGRAVDTDFFILYYEASVNNETIMTDGRFQNFPALAQGDYITGRDENYPECAANNYVQVDVLVRDYAIGMLPDLFPEEEGTCFTRP